MSVERVREKAEAYKHVGRLAKDYLKGTFIARFADNLPEILQGAAYVGFDTFGTIESARVVKNYVTTRLMEGQPYFDFSTPENTAISIGKIALVCLTGGFLYSTVRRTIGYFRDRV